MVNSAGKQKEYRIFFLIFCIMEMKDIVELAKVRGFVYQGSEIYG